MKYKMANEESPKRKFSDPLDEISSKSKIIKASLRIKYMIHRIERSFFSRQIL